MINKNALIYNSLNNKNKVDFLGSCFAKKYNNFGIPRHFFSKLDLKKFLSLPISHFEKIDGDYYLLINDDDLDEFLEDKEKPIFDYCKKDFRLEDELFNSLDSDKKKFYNLYLRNIEKQKFLFSNSEHLKKTNLIVTKVIEKKLLTVWQSKWCTFENYINFEHCSLDNIIYD